MGGPGWVSANDAAFRSRFERLLTAEPTRDYSTGFSLAADIGRPAVPILWEMLLAETSNVARRNALLAAAILAGGPSEDERLFDWLGQQKAIKEERTMAALAIALGPPRSRPVPDFWTRCMGLTKSPEQILAIAVRLAAARIPGTETGAPTLTSSEPGLAAATAFAGLPISPQIWARRWNLRDTDRHAELFWRGALLDGARRDDDQRPIADDLLERAREVVALSGDQFATAHEAAALLRARRQDLRAIGTKPSVRLLQLMASTRASAIALRPWLNAMPQPRDEDPGRLAVAYVLSREPVTVIGDRSAWSADERITAHVSVALAWCLLGVDNPRIDDATLPGVPEWFFVRWACGHQPSPERCKDPTLTTMARLAADGRLPRAAARTALEEALWRWGSHPGLGLLEVEHLLIRDLLLVGSGPGTKYVPSVNFEERYRPTGIGHAEKFFDIAVVLYDFMQTPRLPLPPQYRLR